MASDQDRGLCNNRGLYVVRIKQAHQLFKLLVHRQDNGGGWKGQVTQHASADI